MRAAIAIVALVPGACSDDSFTGLTPAEYNGEFRLVSVNEGSLPAAVETSWIQGTLVSGELLIDFDTNYWMTFNVFQPGVGTTVVQARGNAIPDETGGGISFVGGDNNVQWVGVRTDTTIVIPDLRGLHVVFRRVGNYKSPS